MSAELSPTMTQRLLEAFDLQQDLIVEVRDLTKATENLHRAYTIQKIKLFIIGGLVIVVALLVLWSLHWARTARDAAKTARTAAMAAEETSAKLKAETVENCRVRNAGTREVRNRALTEANFFDSFVTTEQGHTFVAQLRATIPPAEKTDADCDRNGRLDKDDYPSG